MRNLNTPRLLAAAALALALAAGLRAQGADINQPKQRETALDSGRALFSRPAPAPVPENIPNTFAGKPVEAPEQPESSPEVVAPVRTVNDADLLAAVANRIPATGTVVLGGKPLLLVGQKRFKVGDTITIDFEGETYALELVEIAPTNFTVKRGRNQVTRALRLIQ